MNIDICNTFEVYFQIFRNFGYKELKNSEVQAKISTLGFQLRSYFVCETLQEEPRHLAKRHNFNQTRKELMLTEGKVKNQIKSDYGKLCD